MAAQAGERTRPRTTRQKAVERIAKRSASNGHAKAKAQVEDSAPDRHEIVAENAAAARKQGVRLKESSKVVGTFLVFVDGTRVRALGGRFLTAEKAKAAIRAAGLKLAESKS